jgi:putative ABC transport system permease protein
MKITESFILAMKNILSSKLRALLTMLGIIIGVAAVIVIIGLGSGMESYMTNSFKSMGTNLLTVNLFGRGQSSRSVSIDEMYEIVDENSEYLANVSPLVNVNKTVKIGSDTLDTTTISGVGEDYDNMKALALTQGRFLQYVDILKRKDVCVIGSYINNEWFNGNGVGDNIRIGGNLYKVVGVLEEKADSEESGEDDVVYIPYTAAMKLAYTGTISSYTFEVVSEDQITEAKAGIEEKLTEVFGSDSSYRITSLSEMLDTMTGMINIMVTVLAAIAAISLVVGGIGIMNIMLVSVTERTREIGIRKALGAKQHHIMTQFVIEAATTSAIGGVLGIITGYLLCYAGTSIVASITETEMSISPTFTSVMTSFSISAMIGIVFGYLPAKRAAKLNPIEALRYD